MESFFVLLLILVVVVGLALFWLSRNLDGLLKHAIECHGSAMTQANVAVGVVKISPTNGKGSIRRLTVGNPAGFKTTHALKVAQVKIEVDIATVPHDVVLIRRIAVESPDLIYEKGEAFTNFDALSRHIAKSVGASHVRSNPKSGKKLIVELLTVRNAKAQASASFMQGKTVTVSLPDITLRDIGRAKGGVTPGELGQEIVGALKAELSAAAHFERLMKSTSDALDQVGLAVKGWFK